MFDTPRGRGTEPLSPPAERANVWQIVGRRKALVVLGALLGLAAGAAVCARMTPLYQSAAKILVVKKRPDAVTGVDTRQLAVDEYVATQQELLKSSSVLDRAVREGKLAALDSFAGESEDPTEALRKALTVSAVKGPAGQTNVFKLSFRGRQPDDCPAALDAVLASFQKTLAKKYQDVSEDTIDLILRDRDALQKELTREEGEYLKFRETGLVLGKGKNGLDLRQERLNNMQTKRSALLLRRVEVEGQLAAVEAARKAGGSRESVLAMLCEFSAKGDPEDPQRAKTFAVQDELAKLLLEERKLLDAHGPKHQEVQSVRNRIEAARRLLVLPPAAWGAPPDGAARDPVELHLQILRQKLEHSKVEEALLKKVFDDEYEEAKKLAGFEIRDESFQTRIALTKQMYEGLVKRLREVNLVKGVGGFEVETLEPPSPAVRVAPNVPLVLALSALVGLLGGFGTAYLTGVRDRHFRSAADVRGRLGVRVVGAIPAFGPPRKGMLSRGVAGALGLDPMLCTYYRNDSAETEAFRGLRNALCFGAPGGPRVVQITSPQGGEGKSTVAANLAVSVAQSCQNVLLIDANLRRPTAHRLFGVPDEVGLAAVLAGQAEPPEAIQESGIPGLAVLPAGPAPCNPAELLTAPRFKELLDSVREQFDFVIVDSPALLPVTDAGAVARHVDGVLLTVRLGRTDRPQARRALEVLAATGAALLGMVVNDAEPGADPLGYGGAAGYPRGAVGGESDAPRGATANGHAAAHD